MPHLFEEIKTIREALTHFSFDTHKNTWFVLDIDNTVMESKLELGSDQWFSVLFAHGMKSISNIEVAKAAIFVVYHEIQHHIRTKAVELSIRLIISALQDLGIRVLGLTARGEPIMIPTLRQLNDIGIDFSRNAMQKTTTPNYLSGIIFCDGQDKGVALATFLKDVVEHPKHVVMLDDKRKHLDHVSRALRPLNIHFSGLRYGYLDQKVSEFKMHKANAQLAVLFSRLSSDAREAIQLLNLMTAEVDIEAVSSDVLGCFFYHPLQSFESSELSDLSDISEISSLSEDSFRTTSAPP